MLFSLHILIFFFYEILKIYKKNNQLNEYCTKEVQNLLPLPLQQKKGKEEKSTKSDVYCRNSPNNGPSFPN